MGVGAGFCVDIGIGGILWLLPNIREKVDPPVLSASLSLSSSLLSLTPGKCWPIDLTNSLLPNLTAFLLLLSFCTVPIKALEDELCANGEVEEMRTGGEILKCVCRGSGVGGGDDWNVRSLCDLIFCRRRFR